MGTSISPTASVGRVLVGVAAVAAVTLAATACGSSAPSTSTTGSSAAATNPAAVKGNITFYAYWLTNEVGAIVKAFNKEYPNVHVTTYRNGGPEVAQRLLSEKKAGIATADVVSVDTPLMQTLFQDGQLETWLPADAATVPANFKSNYDVAVQLYLNGVMVNTKTYPDKADWPTSWTDFAKPKASWDNKICTADARTISHGYAQVAAEDDVLGRSKTTAIYKGLGEAHTKIYSSAPVGASEVANGSCGILYEIPYQNYVKVKRAGAPVAWVVPKPGMVPVQSRISVVKGSPNEAAARAFVQFTLSPAGQKVFADMGLTPTQPSAPTSWWISNDIAPYSTKLLMTYPEENSYADRTALLNMFTQTMFGK